jgi:phage-related tail protein
MHAGDIFVGLQIGGLQTFVGGWKAAAAAVAKSVQAMGSYVSEMVLSQANAGDEIQKMAQRVDWSTEALSSMRLELELNGASFADLQTSMRGLNRVLDDAKDGLSSADRTLSKLGLSVEQFAGKDGEERFRMVSQALAGIADEGARSAIAMEVFGKSGDKLMPYLNNLSAGTETLAEKLRNVWSQEEADLAAQSHRSADYAVSRALPVGLVNLDPEADRLGEQHEARRHGDQVGG